MEAVGFILPVETLPHGLTVAILESLQVVSAHSSRLGVFSLGFANSLAHPHFHSSKGLSRNPGVGLRQDSFLLLLALGEMCALDPCWEQGRLTGDKTGGEPALVPRTVYHLDGPGPVSCSGDSSED